MASFSTYYEILGISERASHAEIKNAYRKKAYATHPDRNNGDGEQFIQVTTAWETLSDSGRRAEYDAAVERMRNDELRAARNEEEDRLEKERVERERIERERLEREAREKKEAEERIARAKREAQEKAAREKRDAEERAAREKREEEERIARERATSPASVISDEMLEDAIRSVQGNASSDSSVHFDAVPDDVLEEALHSVRGCVSVYDVFASSSPQKRVDTPPPRRVVTPPPATSMGSAFDSAYRAVVREVQRPPRSYQKRSSPRPVEVPPSMQRQKMPTFIRVMLHVDMFAIAVMCVWIVFTFFSDVESLRTVFMSYFAPEYSGNYEEYFWTHMLFLAGISICTSIPLAYLFFLADTIFRWARRS